MNERTLVRNAINGDKRSLEELLILHSDQLYRTAYLYVNNRDDALDVVQETAYKALVAIGQLKNEQYFMTWLTKILINSAYDVLKKKNKEIPIEKMIEFPATKTNKSTETLDLINAIHELKSQYRNAIILFYFHDLPIQEIAKVMNIPENTVKTYLRRGKERLKKLLGGMEYHEKLTAERI
ncbi:sigma-70 family RNA polymerase sigma factor [Bacillus timonensis]|nr:sigma-70 family RNA polymerase sigma factor [Bacillus timonensis]